MSHDAPRVSVVMATWGRGRHILPSVQSVLRQSFATFELLVVGDATTDETEAVVTAIGDPRIRWLNLAERCGSQSAPNNAGIAAARSRIIAYLGHDDVWEPSHLAAVAGCFGSSAVPDFVVSGLLSHMPNGMPGSRVQGLFTEDNAKHRYFFPPSSFAHRRDVIDRIGPWKMPMEVRAPVDEDLLLRAAAADLRFISTGIVTVHKFTSAVRYLSYAQQRSEEQAAVLADIAAPGHEERVADMVAGARRTGKYMIEMARKYDHFAPGQLARYNAAKRGLLRPELCPLGRGSVIRHRREDGALDWEKRPYFGVKRHAQNPQPRLLLPILAEAPAVLTFRAVHPERTALGPLAMRCNEVAIQAEPQGLRPSPWGWSARYEADVRLLRDNASVLELRLTPAQARKVPVGPAQLGFGIGPLQLRPKRPG